ncbi:MAG: heavy-metal-associated domain-containing protein [Cellulomonadaceae bacterium]
MNAPARLALFGAGLAAVFATAFAVAGAVVPPDVATRWEQSAHQNHAVASDDGSAGLSLAQSGYVLGPVTAPTRVGQDGMLTVQVTGPQGLPVTARDADHAQHLHLLVVRSDGTGLRQAHPDPDEGSATWSVPWRWDEAGTYRVFATLDAAEADPVVLSRTVEVAGAFTPAPAPVPTTSVVVDDLEVTVAGNLVPGADSALTFAATRAGAPTDLEPHRGAAGHLVVLRYGDLALVDAQPHPVLDSHATTGPDVVFDVAAPTAGTYLLSLEVKVDGQVRAVPLVLEAAATSESEGTAP